MLPPLTELVKYRVLSDSVGIAHCESGGERKRLRCTRSGSAAGFSGLSSLSPLSIDNADSAKAGRQAGQRTMIARITTVAIHKPICQCKLSLSLLAMSSRNRARLASIRDSIAFNSIRTAAVSPVNLAMTSVLSRSSPPQPIRPRPDSDQVMHGEAMKLLSHDRNAEFGMVARSSSEAG